jgi:hypothetical protein
MQKPKKCIIILFVIFIIIIQNKHRHEFNGIVRQGAPLYLVPHNSGTLPHALRPVFLLLLPFNLSVYISVL